MSSHHFVREGQEPALLILDAISFDAAGPLLEWVPLVLVEAMTLEKVLAWGIKVDVVLAEQGSLFQPLAEYGPVEQISYQPGSCLSTALSYLNEKKHQAVTVLTIDKSVFNTAIQYQTLAINLIDERHRWVYVRTRFDKWYPAQTELQVVKTDENQTIKSSGLSPFNNNWISQVDGMVSLHADKPFWIGETL